jgi:hypothetical protein
MPRSSSERIVVIQSRRVLLVSLLGMVLSVQTLRHVSGFLWCQLRAHALRDYDFVYMKLEYVEYELQSRNKRTVHCTTVAECGFDA